MADRPERTEPNDLTPSSWPHLPFPTFVLQPILRRIVRKIATQNPDMFNRLGPYTRARFIIDPTNFPFALALCPNPDDLSLRACDKRSLPEH
jgi:hypothetical protein